MNLEDKRIEVAIYPFTFDSSDLMGKTTVTKKEKSFSLLYLTSRCGCMVQ